MPCVELVVRGRVQGVGFRRFVQRRAQEHHVSGTVRNLADGGVEVLAEAPAPQLHAFVEAVRKGPAHARVDEVIESWADAPERYRGFDIR